MKSVRVRSADDGNAHPSEIELKLALGKTSTLQLLRHDALVPLQSGPGTREHHTDRYLDSVDGSLAQAGLSLRIRKSQGQWRQTVKDSPRATLGLHARREYESLLARPQPDHEALGRTPWASDFAHLKGRLLPVCEVRYWRRTIPLVFADGSRAALCIDRGHIIAAGASLPIAELEIELVCGNPARLYQLARELASFFALYIEPQSKAQRGMALAGAGWVSEPGADSDFSFKRGDPAAQSIARLCRFALDETYQHVRQARTRQDPEDIHRARKGLRRVRTLLRFATAFDPQHTLGNTDRAAHHCYRSLSAARDWDVLVRDLLTQERSPQFGLALAPIEALVYTAYEAHMAQARCILQSLEFQDLLLAVGGETYEWECRQIGQVDALASRFARQIAGQEKQLRARIERLRGQTPAEQHATRRLARRIRERAELIAGILGPARQVTRYLDRLAHLQEILGRLHDWYSARRLILGLTTTPDIGVHTWLDHGQSEAMRAALKASRRFQNGKSIWH